MSLDSQGVGRDQEATAASPRKGREPRPMAGVTWEGPMIDPSQPAQTRVPSALCGTGAPSPGHHEAT